MDKSKMKTIGIWILQILLGINFIGASIGKVTGDPGIIQNFERWGYFDGFYLVIGIVEIIGAVLLFIPRTAGYAALGLIAVMIGAAGTHLVHAEWVNIIVPVVNIVLLAIVVKVRLPGLSPKPATT